MSGRIETTIPSAVLKQLVQAGAALPGQPPDTSPDEWDQHPCRLTLRTGAGTGRTRVSISRCGDLETTAATETETLEGDDADRTASFRIDAVVLAEVAKSDRERPGAAWRVAAEPVEGGGHRLSLSAVPDKRKPDGMPGWVLHPECESEGTRVPEEPRADTRWTRLTTLSGNELTDALATLSGLLASPSNRATAEIASSLELLSDAEGGAWLASRGPDMTTALPIHGQGPDRPIALWSGTARKIAYALQGTRTRGVVVERLESETEATRYRFRTREEAGEGIELRIEWRAAAVSEPERRTVVEPRALTRLAEAGGERIAVAFTEELEQALEVLRNGHPSEGRWVSGTIRSTPADRAIVIETRDPADGRTRGTARINWRPCDADTGTAMPPFQVRLARVATALEQMRMVHKSLTVEITGPAKDPTAVAYVVMRIPWKNGPIAAVTARQIEEPKGAAA